MADVSVDATISTATARGMRSLVFTTDLIGYCIYVDSAGLSYSKTTDGGATWGAAVVLTTATTTIAFDVWYDQWTPGNTGANIYIWRFDSTNDQVSCSRLETATDTHTGSAIVFAAASAVAGRGAFVSGCKTRSGYLYCAYDIDAGAERGLHRSTTGGGAGTWSANLSTTFVEATLDTCKLYPASGTGDDNDCWALYYDASATALTLKLWDSSAASQVESATIQTHTDGATDLTGQFGYDAAVRHSDGHVIVAALSARDVAASTHQVFDVASTSSFTTKTAIAASTDDHYYPQVFIDQNSDTIYVAYNGKRDGSETLDTATKVYYTKSTDGGTTWTAGDTAYLEGAAGVVLQVWTPPMGPRLYAVWRVGTTLLGNKVTSVTFGIAGATIAAGSSIAIPTVSPGAVTLTGDTIAAGSGVNAGTVAGTGADQAVDGAPLAMTSSTFSGVEDPLSEGGLWVAPGSWGPLAKNTGAYASTSSDAARLTVAVSADQYSEITYDQDPGASSWVGVMTRIQPSSGSGYLAIANLNVGVPGDVLLYRVTDTGTLGFTFLDGLTANIGTSPRRLRLTSVGNVHTITHNGVDLVVFTDSTYPDGSVGIASAVYGGPTVLTQTFTGGSVSAAQLFAGTVAAAADQAVVGSTLATAATVFAGSVTPGAVTVSGATQSSTAGLTAGSVTPGAVTVSGATQSSTAGLSAGSVTPGAVTVSGATRSSTAGLSAGTATPGAVTLSGATLTSGAILAAGTATPGAVTVSGTTRSSTAGLSPGTVTPGAVTVSGTTRSTTAGLSAGTVTPGAVTVSGTTRASSAVLTAGGITTTGAGILTGATLAPSAQLFAGTVTLEVALPVPPSGGRRRWRGLVPVPAAVIVGVAVVEMGGPAIRAHGLVVERPVVGAGGFETPRIAVTASGRVDRAWLRARAEDAALVSGNGVDVYDEEFALTGAGAGPR